MVYRVSLGLNNILCLALGFCALSACTGGQDSSVIERADSAGVQIVLSSGSDRVLDWQLHRLFALGGSDQGPESFFRVSPQLVGADAGGNLFVLDPQNARIVTFDTDGHFVRSMGGTGGGPGEFQMPGSMWVSPDGAVAVFDYGKGNLVHFDKSGEVLREQPFPIFPPPTRQRHFGQLHDTILVLTRIPAVDTDGQREVLWHIAGSDTLILAQVLLPPAAMSMFPGCGGGLRLPPLFSPEVAWDTRAAVVAVSSSHEYSIDVIRLGQFTTRVRRDMSPSPASQGLAIEHLGEGFRINFGRGPCLIEPAEMVDKRGYAKFVPLIQTVLLSPAGELWVQRFAMGQDSVGPVDVFNTSGAYIGTLALGSLVPVVLLPDDRVGIVEKDELDVERLVVMSIER